MKILAVTWLATLVTPRMVELVQGHQLPLMRGRKDVLGVGFDLTMDYGAAAVLYENASLHDVVKIAGGDEYEILMRRLASSSTSNPCFDGGHEDFLGLSSRAYWARRWFNNLRGLPATPEIGVLSALLHKLHNETSNKLGTTVTTAVISSPDLQGRLSVLDLSQAASDAGFTLQPTRHFGGVTETSAAFAASGHGLCKHYDDLVLCENEEFDMPGKMVLRLTLSDAAFTASCSYMRSAYIDWNEAEMYRFDLGAKSWGEGAGEELKIAIVSVGRDCERMPDTLLLLGERAGHPTLQQAVHDALWELAPNASDPHPARATPFVKPDPTFLAARGSAEFAWRALAGGETCASDSRRFL